MNKKTLIIIIAAALVVIIAAGVTVMCIVNNNTEPSHPQFVGHRGYSSVHYSNTASAFQGAAELDFYGIETDIHQTKDGYIICNHDSDIKFADGTSAVIAESNLADLVNKQLKPDHTGEVAYVCMFSEYLDICKSGSKIAVIELKNVFTAEMIEKVFEIIDQHYDRDHCTVIAFDYDSLYRVRQFDENVDLQYLSSKKRDPKFKECLEKNISIDIHYSICNKRLVQKFHDKGLKVNVWTVDGEKDLKRMQNYGVDYVTSNVFYKEP